MAENQCATDYPRHFGYFGQRSHLPVAVLFGQRGRDQLPYSLEGALPHYFGQCGHPPVAALFGRRGRDPLPWPLESVMSVATAPRCLIL